MKSAKVYSVTAWYAKCPDCKTEYHVRDDAPPFFAAQIHCKRCDRLFEADLADRIADRIRAEKLRSEPLQETPRTIDNPRPVGQLERIEESIKKIGKGECGCQGAEFGRHGIYCEAQRREARRRGRSHEW